jgi:hypothetical protein
MFTGGNCLWLAVGGSADVLRARRPRYQAVRPWQAVAYIAELQENRPLPLRGTTLHEQGSLGLYSA